MDARRAVVTEMEWWDRIAMAVDRLLADPDARRRDLKNELPSGVAAHIFDEVRDVESLRRLTQMPDETPADLLRLPFAAYCPEISAFVSVNDPDTPLATHLKYLKEFAA